MAFADGVTSSPVNALTAARPVGYVDRIADHEAQVERQRIDNPQITMKGSGALVLTMVAAPTFGGDASRRLH